MASEGDNQFRRLSTLMWPAAYMTADAAILQANEPFHNLWRLHHGGAGAPEGQPLFTLFADDDRRTVPETLATGSPRAATRRLRLAGAPAASVVTMFAPIQRRSRCAVTWLVQLRQYEAAALAVSEEAKVLTAGLVHDLKTPIQVVLGWTSVLKRSSGDPEYIDRVLTIIERNARLQMTLVEDLLGLLRPALSPPTVVREELDLADLVRGEVNALAPLASERNVGLSFTTDSARIWVKGHDVQLRRVVANLVGNALKFTPPSGTVRCRLWRSATTAGLVVSDTGKGIDASFLPKIFDAFRQESDERTSEDNGLGLGLCLSRRLIEQHGGSIKATSAGSGRGATFTVLLPAVGAQPTSAAPAVA
jgi:signal transduction histidine kinase